MLFLRALQVAFSRTGNDSQQEEMFFNCYLWHQKRAKIAFASQDSFCCIFHLYLAMSCGPHKIRILEINLARDRC